jgi:hypothetical protein
VHEASAGRESTLSIVCVVVGDEGSRTSSQGPQEEVCNLFFEAGAGERINRGVLLLDLGGGVQELVCPLQGLLPRLATRWRGRLAAVRWRGWCISGGLL